jgi:hypothetical protein
MFKNMQDPPLSASRHSGQRTEILQKIILLVEET